MPYIDAPSRKEYQAAIVALPDCANPGELNFMITQLFIWYLNCKGINYAHLNDCVGAANCAVAELTRKVIRPYEINKCNENGDVYDALIGA